MVRTGKRKVARTSVCNFRRLPTNPSANLAIIHTTCRRCKIKRPPLPLSIFLNSSEKIWGGEFAATKLPAFNQQSG